VSTVGSTALKRTLTTSSLVAVMFFSVSGGAYSIEGLVEATGPGLALAMLIALPLCYSLPETLIVGELASMLPEEGGYYRWVTRAFGQAWGFQNGWTTWLYSLVDMALYPVLFNLYLKWFFPGLSDRLLWLVSLALIWGCTAVNLRGAFSVGRVSEWAGAFIILGFIALGVIALPHWSHSPWIPFTKPEGSISAGLAVGLSTALWNFIGWDNASTVQGEVVDPSRTYPRALAIALPLVAITYLIPVVPALAATDWSTWKEGSWPHIAQAMGGTSGTVVAWWLALGGMLGAAGLFNALLLSYSRLPLALAGDGLLPAFIGATDERGTPRNAILVAAVCYSVFTLLPFGSLIVADVLLYSSALLMELASLVQLRRNEPALRGAFRIPLGTGGVALLAVMPAVVLVMVVVLSYVDGEVALPSLLSAAGAMAVGPLVYRFCRPKST
jgi:amino acid transporter